VSSELARPGEYLPDPATHDPANTRLGSVREADTLDISVVMPCLNEERSVGICVRKAWYGISSSGLSGEVIVVDNGSTDRSVVEAVAAGARVVHQPERGYGNAYLKGFSVARGRIIVMGDSDDSYDFTAISDLIEPIADGYEYVLGSRFAGHIRPEAMSWSHRRIGNPILTKLLNALFRLKVSDAHSGFRALTRTALEKMSLQAEGMEFASEIVVKAARANIRTTEIPITYHPRIGESKLNSLRDGWRHLRFLLLLSPDYVFILPGLLFTALGFLGQLSLLGFKGPDLLFTKVMLAFLTLGGSRLLMLGLFAKLHARGIGLENSSRASELVEKIFTLERGLVVATGLAAAGLSIVIAQAVAGLGTVAAGGTPASILILGLVCLALGGKLWFDAFFMSMVMLRRPQGRHHEARGRHAVAGRHEAPPRPEIAPKPDPLASIGEVGAAGAEVVRPAEA
jgi:glycosyltransferase involved in cell wall biosynthesis